MSLADDYCALNLTLFFNHTDTVRSTDQLFCDLRATAASNPIDRTTTQSSAANMSLTLIFGYVAISMFVYMFFHYKFLKIFDGCTSFGMRQLPAILAVAIKRSHLRHHDDKADGAHQRPGVVVVGERRRGVWDIPGPAIVPFLGTKWIFLWKYSMTQLHKVYEEFSRYYGPIALEVTPGGIPIVLLFDRKDIEKVLRYPSKYPFRPPTDIVATYRNSRPDRYASVGITNEQGANWYHLRSKLTPMMTSPRVLQAFMPALNEICDDFLELLRQKRCPRTHIVDNFQDVANLMGLEAVCTLMLGRRMGFLSAKPDNDVLALAGAVKTLFATQRDSTFGLGMWRYVPTKTWRDFRRSEELIYSIVSEMVDRAMTENHKSMTPDNDVRSVFLGILKEEDLDNREKKSAIIDFISAGIETLANTLSFILYYTTQSKKIQDTILGEFRNCDTQLDANDLSGAMYTKACVQETYRICPTAFCLARILEEDTALSGYDLRAGTVVLCQTMLACNNDDNFADAKTFRPSRWIDTAHLDTSLVVPFGIGRRTCPGRRFVDMELTLLLAKMVRRFEMSYCGELQTEFEYLLVPKTPVGIRLRDRTPIAGA